MSIKSPTINGKYVSIQILIIIFGFYVLQCIYTAKNTKVPKLTFKDFFTKFKTFQRPFQDISKTFYKIQDISKTLKTDIQIETFKDFKDRYEHCYRRFVVDAILHWISHKVAQFREEKRSRISLI